jgi:glycosyltransferase involved in cell wall biosynthesis
MKRLLMIAYDFPPLLPGARRAAAFARYLGGFGWKVDVLTVKTVRSWAYDPAPLRDLAKRGVRIFRSGSRDPYRLAYLLAQRRRSSGKGAGASGGAKVGGVGRRGMAWLRRHWFCPDDRIGWVGPATRLALELIEREDYGAIWTTSFPHSAHLVGLRVKRRHPRLPWVADFRDGWTQNPQFFEPLSRRMRAKSAALERHVARSADAIVAVSEPITEHFRALVAQSDPRRDDKPVVTITNGFDPADIKAAEPKKWEGFSLLYAGSLLASTSGEPFFAMAAEAIRRDAGLRHSLRLVFVGAFGPELRAAAEKYGLSDRLVLPGPLPYLESLGAQKGASVLLGLATRGPNAEAITTQKIFENFATGRPALVLAPEGSLKNLVESLGGGVVCDPEDPSAAAQALIEIQHHLAAGQWRPVSSEALKPYDRRELTGTLAGLLAMIRHSARTP